MIKNLAYQRAEPDQTAGWYVPGDNMKHFDGFIGKMTLEKGMKEFFDTKSAAFCNALRCMVSAMVKKKELAKPSFMKKHNLSSREYNLVLSTATGMVESANTLLEDRREQIASNIESLKEKITSHTVAKDAAMKQRLLLRDKINAHNKASFREKTEGENKAVLTENQLQEVSRKLFKATHTFRIKKKSIAYYQGRLKRAERKFASLPAKPHIFVFGKKAFYDQPTLPDFQRDIPYHHETPATTDARRLEHIDIHTPSLKAAQKLWREEYRKYRNAMFGARESGDEVGGNSTYRITFKNIVFKTTKYLCGTTPYHNYVFNVHHQGKLLGTFSLSEKKGQQLQQILIANNSPFAKSPGKKDITDRTALKVIFRYQAGRWHIHIGYEMKCLTKIERFMDVLGAIGIDTNHGHFDSMEVSFNGKTFRLGEYHKNAYDIDSPRGVKKADISAHIRRIVYRAHELGYAVAMENLDWEHGQKSGSKLGATLSAMPYRAILHKVMRECARLGVPFRLVNAHYTSILGNLLATKDYRLGRDVAAAGIIAMLGLSPRALDTHLKEIVASAKSLRINVKNKFGRTITVIELNLDLLETKGDKKTDQPEKVGAYRGRLGRAVKNIARSIRRHRPSGKIQCYPRRIKKGKNSTVCKSPHDKGEPNPCKSTSPSCKTTLPHPSQGNQL